MNSLSEHRWKQSPLYCFETAKVAQSGALLRCATHQKVRTMNCEKYQDLLSDFSDGSLAPEDHNSVAGHLSVCAVCTDARNDLGAVVRFCLDHRDEYEAVPNERALWLRISNVIEGEQPGRALIAIPENVGWWFRLMTRSWQLSFPKFAAPPLATTLCSTFTIVPSPTSHFT